ncbi:MAG: hypothetical protein IIT58_11300 [Treponema sp.]|nr:hypothetical protein [Treponema sp.]
MEITDEYFISVLKECLAEQKEYWEYLKNTEDSELFEIRDEYKNNYDDLNGILSHIKTIDDLSLTDEDTIGFVFECLESHAESFIIDHTDKKSLKASQKEYEKLEALLDLFYDEDDEEEDF